jgi:hypothetical protein
MPSFVVVLYSLKATECRHLEYAKVLSTGTFGV